MLKVPIVVLLLDDSDTQVGAERTPVCFRKHTRVFEAHSCVFGSTSMCFKHFRVFLLLTVFLASLKNFEILPEFSRVFESVFDFSAKRQTRLAR